MSSKINATVERICQFLFFRAARTTATMAIHLSRKKKNTPWWLSGCNGDLVHSFFFFLYYLANSGKDGSREQQYVRR